jgi:flavin-binding protein dodecin
MRSDVFAYSVIQGGPVMAVHKVIEVLSQSNESWEDAAQLAVQDAAKTLKGIKSIYISHLQGDVEKGKIVRFRVNAKITFEVKS